MGETDADDRRSSDEDVVVERLPPDEAFELLAHETRFRILEVLNEADRPLAFGDLRERVGVRDPGQFNYHLGKITGRFVESGEEGYELSASGVQVVGAVLSGGYTKALDSGLVSTDAPCIKCGDSMEVRLHDTRVQITCPECGDYTDMNVPPGVLEGYAPEEIAAVVNRWTKRMAHAAEFEFCHLCDGVLERTVYAAGGEDAPNWLDDEGVGGVADYECSRCGNSWYSVVETAVLTHPAVVAFHYDHGIDLRETPYWDLDWLEPHLATVTDHDPVRIEIPVTLEDETRVFVFDADLDVVDERRETTEG